MKLHYEAVPIIHFPHLEQKSSPVFITFIFRQSFIFPGLLKDFIYFFCCVIAPVKERDTIIRYRCPCDLFEVLQPLFQCCQHIRETLYAPSGYRFQLLHICIKSAIFCKHRLVRPKCSNNLYTEILLLKLFMVSQIIHRILCRR